MLLLQRFATQEESGSICGEAKGSGWSGWAGAVAPGGTAMCDEQGGLHGGEAKLGGGGYDAMICTNQPGIQDIHIEGEHSATQRSRHDFVSELLKYSIFFMVKEKAKVKLKA